MTTIFLMLALAFGWGTEAPTTALVGWGTEAPSGR
jgi:hypothetical protein